MSVPSHPEAHAASALARVKVPAGPVRAGVRRRCRGTAEKASSAEPRIRAGVILRAGMADNVVVGQLSGQDTLRGDY